MKAYRKILVVGFLSFFLPACVHGAQLIAHWSFDEGKGGIAHDSVGGNHGQIHGADWTEGRAGSALEFDGEKSYVRVKHSDDFNLTELTISAWIYLKAYPEGFPIGSGGIVGKNHYTESVYSLRIGHGRKLHYRVYGPFGEGGAYSHFDYGRLNQYEAELNTWRHITVTQGGSRVRFYVDGLLDTEYEESRHPGINNFDVFIGAVSAGGRFFEGIIDEVKIYKGVLEQEDIMKEYQSYL